MYFSTIPPIENAFEFECSVIVCVRSRLGTSYTSSILCYPRRHRVYFHCNAGFFSSRECIVPIGRIRHTLNGNWRTTVYVEHPCMPSPGICKIPAWAITFTKNHSLHNKVRFLKACNKEEELEGWCSL